MSARHPARVRFGTRDDHPDSRWHWNSSTVMARNSAGALYTACASHFNSRISLFFNNLLRKIFPSDPIEERKGMSVISSISSQQNVCYTFVLFDYIILTASWTDRIILLSLRQVTITDKCTNVLQITMILMYINYCHDFLYTVICGINYY